MHTPDDMEAMEVSLQVQYAQRVQNAKHAHLTCFYNLLSFWMILQANFL